MNRDAISQFSWKAKTPAYRLRFPKKSISPPWSRQGSRHGGIHAYIYRQFNVILTSTLLFSIKKSPAQSKEKVLRWALKGKSHLIRMLCVRGEMSFSILSNEAARLSLCSVEFWWKKIMILNALKL